MFQCIYRIIYHLKIFVMDCIIYVIFWMKLDMKEFKVYNKAINKNSVNSVQILIYL